MTAQPDPSSAWATQSAAEWFVENRSGSLSTSRKAEFVRWLGASPLHIKEYLAIARTAVDVAGVAKSMDVPIAQLLAEAASEDSVIPLSARAESRVMPLPRRFAFARPAAILALGATACLVLAMTGWRWLHDSPTADHHDYQYSADSGEDRTVKLPDDTAVYLTGNSSVRVRFETHRRMVQVERGQALFEVAHDSARPFEVRAGNTVIEDVGTVFDVSREPQRTVVTVLEGQVLLWGIRPPSGESAHGSSADSLTFAQPPPLQVDLGAGDQASILPTGAVTTRRPRDLIHAAPWLKPQIVFDGETLAGVAAEFNRHNREQIEISDPQVGSLPLSGVFHSYDVASFASFLNSLHGVRATMANGRLRVSATSEPNSSNPP